MSESRPVYEKLVWESVVSQQVQGVTNSPPTFVRRAKVPGGYIVSVQWPSSPVATFFLACERWDVETVRG